MSVLFPTPLGRQKPSPVLTGAEEHGLTFRVRAKRIFHTKLAIENQICEPNWSEEPHCERG